MKKECEIKSTLIKKILAKGLPVIAGYKCYDFDGNPWHNPPLCHLCKKEITQKRYDDYGVCKKCGET